MRTGKTYLFAAATFLAMAGAARADSVRLSLGVSAIGPVEARRTLGEGSLELAFYSLPCFLVFEPARHREGVAPLDTSEAEWLRARPLEERVALRLHSFGPPPAPLMPIRLAAPAALAPLFEPLRVLADMIAARANELVAPGMSVEVGDRIDERYTALHGLAGDIQRGQYLRSDDVTGRQFNFDLRLVVAWRPNDLIRLEAGYGIAYLSGEGHTDFGPTGPLGGERPASYLIHGPCASFNFDF